MADCVPIWTQNQLVICLCQLNRSPQIPRLKPRFKYQCFIFLRIWNIPRQYINSIIFRTQIFTKRRVEKIVNYFIHEFIQKAYYLNVFFYRLLQSIRFGLIHEMSFALILIKNRAAWQKLVINSTEIIE